MQLADSTFIVTGGASGLGAATVRMVVAGGGNAVIAYLKEAEGRALAQELGPRGIRVNVVSAGVVDTDALAYFPNRDELLADFARRTPAGPVLTPQDVAGAVYLLCLPEARMINGHTLVVDGGFAISG